MAVNWIVDNWCVLTGLIALVIAACIYLFQTDKKRVLEWLLVAVTMAEKELGSGTGKLKLRMVYDSFIDKFRVFSKIVSFKTFSKMVDKALDEMKKILESNLAVQAFVGVSVKDDGEQKEDA